MLRRRAARGREEVDLDQISDARTVLADARGRRTRRDQRAGRAGTSSTSSGPPGRLAGVEVGASPARRPGAAAAARARAALAGRDFVLPDDVKALAVACLAHRLTLRPDLWLQRQPARGAGRPVPRLGPGAGRCPIQ